MPQIASSLTIDNMSMIEGAITGNGRYHAFSSGPIGTANNKAISATLSLESIVPDREGLGKALVTLVLEREDDAGNWRTVHSLAEPLQAIALGPNENGGIIPENELTYGPLAVTDVNGVFVSSDGQNIILKEHPKKGVLPDSVRLCVVVHERDFGNVGAFQSMTFSLDYELRAE